MFRWFFSSQNCFRENNRGSCVYACSVIEVCQRSRVKLRGFKEVASIFGEAVLIKVWQTPIVVTSLACASCEVLCGITASVWNK